MNWINTLAQTYDNLIKQGVTNLLPIAHSIQNAHIEITINSKSEIINAELVSFNDTVTLIPVTEDSASRGNGVFPHPLCDKLIYLAGDYKDYVNLNGSEFYDEYMRQLSLWKESSFTNPKINIIYNYLKKSTLIADLVEHKVLFVDEKNKLLDKFQTDKKISTGNQGDSFVRFRVVTDDNLVDAVWQDERLFEDYIKYFNSRLSEKEFCYATGDVVPITNKHPSKITHSGDKSKIISANDTANFTFKGRFHSASEAATIGYEVSQKAHNALKWLITNQGKRIGKKTFLLWGIDNEEMPNCLNDTADFSLNILGISEDIDYSKKELAKEFNKSIDGYKSSINPNTKLSLIGLEPPTTGRLAIIFYREYNGLEGNELIDSIEKWHKETSWNHHYKFVNKQKTNFYGAPSILDIAKIAYGNEQNGIIKLDDDLTANIVERLLPSVIEKRKIPKDVALKLIEKSKCPQNYENVYNWHKVLTITCAVYRKYLLDYEKEVYTMEVKTTDNLAYNCGRLLAVADAIENWSLRETSGSNDVRTTNAIRYFTKFSNSPALAWGIINDKLIPHKTKLGIRGTKLYKLLGEISSLIDPDEFQKVRNLDGCLILGYDTQRQALFNTIKEEKNMEEK